MSGCTNLGTSLLWTTFPGQEVDSIFCVGIDESDSCNSNPNRALVRYRYCRYDKSSERSVGGSASLARKLSAGRYIKIYIKLTSSRARMCPASITAFV